MPMIVLAYPTSQSCAWALLQELCINLQSTPSIFFWYRRLYQKSVPSRLYQTSVPSGHHGVMARWPAEAWTWTQTWALPPDQQLSMKVLSAQKPAEYTVWSLAGCTNCPTQHPPLAAARTSLSLPWAQWQWAATQQCNAKAGALLQVADASQFHCLPSCSLWGYHANSPPALPALVPFW